MDNQISNKKAFPYHAAKWSWLSLIVGGIFMSFANNVSGVAGDTVMLAAVVASLILGSLALMGIPQYGPKGILIPALFGIILSLLLVLIGVTNFIEAANRGSAARSTM